MRWLDSPKSFGYRVSSRYSQTLSNEFRVPLPIIGTAAGANSSPLLEAEGAVLVLPSSFEKNVIVSQQLSKFGVIGQLGQFTVSDSFWPTLDKKIPRIFSRTSERFPSPLRSLGR